MESYLDQDCQLTSTLSELIYHVMFLDYPKSLRLYNNLHLPFTISTFFTSSKGIMSEFNFTYTSHFDVIFILFLTPYLSRFCLVLRSILITVLNGRVLRGFQKPCPSNNFSLHFTIEPRPSVTTHFFFIRNLKTIGNY